MVFELRQGRTATSQANCDPRAVHAGCELCPTAPASSTKAAWSRHPPRASSVSFVPAASSAQLYGRALPKPRGQRPLALGWPRRRPSGQLHPSPSQLRPPAAPLRPFRHKLWDNTNKTRSKNKKTTSSSAKMKHGLAQSRQSGSK